MSLTLGTDDYREGALLRLNEARTLYDAGKWTGAIYLAGRAVESMFRSLLRLKNRKLETGHDLRMLLKKTQSLGLLGDQNTELQDSINEIAVVWHNNLRFMGDGCMGRLLDASGRAKRIGAMKIKGDPIKANAKRIVEACERIVSRGEKAWSSLRKK